MDLRREQLYELQSFINNADNDLTMILQSLQWDKKGLQNPIRVGCKYDENHRMHPDKREQHEVNCFLKSEGYSSLDKMLPDPLDPEANNLVKFCETDINNIIEYAAKINPLFNKVLELIKHCSGCGGVQPLTFERLQASYTADERCAIHDAVLKTLPSHQQIKELQLPGGEGDEGRKKGKSLLETEAELRDMKRRRTKYRTAPKTKHYSDVLRQVINTQMELYSEMMADANEIQKNRQSKSENRDQEVKEHTSTINKNEQVSRKELRDYKGDSWRREYHSEDRRQKERDREDKYDKKYRNEYRSEKYRRDGDSYVGKRDSHKSQSGEKRKRRHEERESHNRKRSPERDEEEKYRRYYDTEHEKRKRRYYEKY